MIAALLPPGALLAEVLPAGVEVRMRLESPVRPADKNEKFSGLVVLPVFAEGREVLPANCRIEGEVRGDRKHVVLSPRYLYLPSGRRVEFNAAVREINQKELKAEEREGTIEQKGSKADAARQAAQIGMTGAGVGAMSTGSATGMGIGAAAGVAAVLIGRQIAGRHHATVIPAGTQITLNLTRAVEIPDGAATGAPGEKGSSDPDERRPILRRNIFQRNDGAHLLSF